MHYADALFLSWFKKRAVLEVLADCPPFVHSKLRFRVTLLVGLWVTRLLRLLLVLGLVLPWLVPYTPSTRVALQGEWGSTRTHFTIWMNGGHRCTIEDVVAESALVPERCTPQPDAEAHCTALYALKPEEAPRVSWGGLLDRCWRYHEASHCDVDAMLTGVTTEDQARERLDTCLAYAQTAEFMRHAQVLFNRTAGPHSDTVWGRDFWVWEETWHRCDHDEFMPPIFSVSDCAPGEPPLRCAAEMQRFLTPGAYALAAAGASLSAQATSMTAYLEEVVGVDASCSPGACPAALQASDLDAARAAYVACTGRRLEEAPSAALTFADMVNAVSTASMMALNNTNTFGLRAYLLARLREPGYEVLRDYVDQLNATDQRQWFILASRLLQARGVVYATNVAVQVLTQVMGLGNDIYGAILLYPLLLLLLATLAQYLLVRLPAAAGRSVMYVVDRTWALYAAYAMGSTHLLRYIIEHSFATRAACLGIKPPSGYQLTQSSYYSLLSPMSLLITIHVWNMDPDRGQGVEDWVEEQVVPLLYPTLPKRALHIMSYELAIRKTRFAPSGQL